MKRILIVGGNSYIGRSLYAWLNTNPNQYQVELVQARNNAWKKADFSKFNTVVNVAGIAHIRKITSNMKDIFFAVNRDMSIEVAKWAKEHGVRHYIQFSSMNVYGDYVDCLKDRSAVAPTSFYGESKLEGDVGVQRLADQNFAVSIIRPPFVYGKGCKGNYNTISSIAKKTPVFPEYKNQKSMIYIDNLTEFIRLVIDNELNGILTPQNKELVSTAELVRQIAKVHNKIVMFTRVFNWGIKPACELTRLVRRAFANDCYDLSLSDYYGFQYCVVGFEESIRRTEC